MSLVIWHNPRCSKSRQTLAILEEKGLSPEVRLYLEDAPSVDEIKTALTQLGKAPRDIIRTGEEAYKEQSLKDVDDAGLIEAMHNTPKLIERPIVFKGDQARVGRPPESVLEIL